MKIPKRHTLRHYIALACKFYGEPEESAKEYIEDRMTACEDKLDAAIECFRGLLPADMTEGHRVEANYPRSSNLKPWMEDRKRKVGVNTQ